MPESTGTLYYAQFDVPELPIDAESLIRAAVKLNGTHIKKSGRGPGSLEDESTAGLDYTVLTGDKVQLHLPWLWNLYHSSIKEYVELSLGFEVIPSPDIASSININCIEGSGGRYELHTDGLPYTAVLFITRHREEGQLILQDSDESLTMFEPKPGRCIVFDGSVTPHAVLPLKHDSIRLTVPMVYHPADLDLSRPESLSDYLYSQTENPTHQEPSP